MSIEIKVSPVELDVLRSKIDVIDEELVNVLARRFEVTARVGELKKQLVLSPVDREREAQQVIKYRALAKHHGLEPELVVSLFKMIIEEVVVNHRRA